MSERRATEHGYSLIELTVVVFIVGVLASIAVSTYFGQRAKATHAAAASALRTQHVIAESIRHGDQPRAYSADLADYRAAERAYTYVAGDEGSTDPSTVSVWGDDGTRVAFAVRGHGECLYLRIDADASAAYRDRRELAPGVACQADEFRSGDGAGW